MKKIAKSKLLTGILVPTTTLCIAAGAAGLVLGIRKNNDTTPAFLDGKTVTFSAGEGKIVSGNSSTTVESGTSMDRVEQPQVKANNPKKIFAGWQDETGGIIQGNKPIRKDTKLTALYNNANSSEYVSVYFTNDPKQPGPAIKGNQLISVNKGYFFFQVNRPTATWTVETEVGGVKVVKTKFFKGWKYSTGTPVKENDRITSNITLYPIFNEAVTITWDPNGSIPETIKGTGKIKRGQSTTTLETGETFFNFNQPAVHVVNESGEEIGNAYFEGWYKEKACTTPWLHDDVITKDTVAYAKWIEEPTPGDKYGLVTFDKPKSTLSDGTVLPDDLTFSWTPSNMVAVTLNDKLWQNTNKPSLVCQKEGVLVDDYKVDKWEIYDTATSEWKALSDTATFTQKQNKVRPILTYAINSLLVYGETTAQLEKSYQYNVKVNGTTYADPSTVSWRLVKDASGKDDPFPDALAKINDAGLVEVKSVSRSLWEQENLNCFYVKATSKLNTNAYNYLKVSLEMPYVGNTYIWIHTESESNPKWYFADASEFCNIESKDAIATTAFADGTTKRYFDKNTDFTETITFGTELGAVPENFLANWRSFKGTVDLANSDISAIGNNFMANCENFNNKISLNKIITIGANFLKGCTSYNSPITFDAQAPLSYIQESFLHGCTSFNSTITLPGKTPLWIDNAFMFGCTSYNQKLVLPSIITYIGDSFMSECNSFTSELETGVQMVDESTGEPKFVVSRNSLSSTNMSSDIYQIGFTVTGTEASDFKKQYTTIADGLHYRTINAQPWTGDVTEAEFTAAKKKLQTTWNLNTTISNGTRTLGTFEVDGDKLPTNTNDATWHRMKITNGGQSMFIKPNATKPAWEDWLDANGNWSDTVAQPVKQMSYGIKNLHTLLSAESDSKSAWTLDTANKWYTIGDTTTGKRVTIKFKNVTKEIENVKFETYVAETSSWVTGFTYAINSINSTTVTLPEGFFHLNTTTHDTTAKTFTGTDSTALSSTSHGAGFLMSLAGYTAGLPSTFELSTSVGGVASNQIKKAVLIKSDNSETQITVNTDPLTQKQIITLPAGAAATDYILVATNAGATTGAMTFIAKETTATTLTIAHDTSILPAGTTSAIYSDEECSSELSWSTAYNVTSATAQKFYVKLAATSGTLSVNIDLAASTYKVGSADAIALNAGASKVHCANTSTEGVYEITIDPNTMTDATSINFVYAVKSVTCSISDGDISITDDENATFTYYALDGKTVITTPSWTIPCTAGTYPSFKIKATTSKTLESGKYVRLDRTNSKVTVGGKEHSLSDYFNTTEGPSGAYNLVTFVIPSPEKLTSDMTLKIVFYIGSI